MGNQPCRCNVDCDKFQYSIAKYNVYCNQNSSDYPATPDGNNGSAELIASHGLDDGVGGSDATGLQFASALPNLMLGNYFWVRTEDNKATEGIASNVIGRLTASFTLDGHIYLGGGTDPLPGVPVLLLGAATVAVPTDKNGAG